jgi:hypothetical protein
VDTAGARLVLIFQRITQAGAQIAPPLPHALRHLPILRGIVLAMLLGVAPTMQLP